MRPPRRRARAALLVTGGVLVAVLAVGGVAWARSGGGPGYRTAVVSRGPVTAGLDLVGTVQPAQAATVGFAQPGTVASVDVHVGQQVTAGQEVARLDLTTLQAKLASAQAAEAAARLADTQAENGQLPAGGGGAGGSAASSAGARSGGSGPTAQQQAVTAAQKAVQSAEAAAEQDLTAASAACGGTAPAAAAPPAAASPATPRTRTSSSGAPAGTAKASPAASGAANTPAAAGGTAPASGSTSSADCLGAESTLLQAERAVSTDQAALTTAQTALTKAQTALTKAQTAGATPATTAPTAAQLAQYRAALDAAGAAVGVAQQALDQGTAVSPLTGTVVAVGLLPGQQVTAASSTAVVEVAAPGGYRVTTTVPTARIGQVVVGQHARVTPDGGGALDASVSSVGVVPGSSGYPVVLDLAGGTGLHVGSSAAVSLTTGSVADAVVVPTSAVRTVGARHVVEVLTGGTVAPVAVTTGATGPLRTQVLSGLQVGQRVVLADLSSTVTSDSTTTGAGAFGGGAGRFGGAGARTGRAGG